MVKLILSDNNQLTILEDALVRANIPYITEDFNYEHGITPPYLVVDGVGLDLCAAMTWIADHQN